MDVQVKLGNTYLNAFHNASSFFISKEDWERSLIINFLFQPEIYIPERGIFSHRYINRYLEEKKDIFGGYGKSLLEEGLYNSCIVPIYQRGSHEAFIEEVEKKTLIDMAPETHENIDKLKRRVRKSTFWPDRNIYNFGIEYEKRIKKVFFSDSPVKDFSSLSLSDKRYLEKEWNDSQFKRWRNEGINRACEITQREGEDSGIRLTDLALAINEECKLIKNPPKNMRIEELTKSAQDKDPEGLYRKIDIFFKIACEIYNQNYAYGMELRNSSCNVDFATNATTIGTCLRFNEAKRYQIKIPRINELKQFDGKTLLNLRCNKKYEYYMEKYINYLSGEEKDDDELADCLSQYSIHINEELKRYIDKIQVIDILLFAEEVSSKGAMIHYIFPPGLSYIIHAFIAIPELLKFMENSIAKNENIPFCIENNLRVGNEINYEPIKPDNN